MSDHKVVLINPNEKVNLADAKALAARYNADLVFSPFVPLGRAFLANASSFEIAD